MSFDDAWFRFMEARNKPLQERFPGHYRAVVVETNDPLNMGRVRFRCPDMHDADLEVNMCPWASPATDLGGSAKRFVSACIGDWIWVSFEKQHPYGPVYTGFADPMKRRLYSLPHIHRPTGESFDANGTLQAAKKDYDDPFLPLDGRPMSHGWQDRYGNIDLHSSIGFFPVEHSEAPDSLGNETFNKPKVNEPDRKYLMRSTKYGHMMIMSDVGYAWYKKNDVGEFTGNVAVDEQFEIDRWKYYQRVANEDKAKDSDQRRILIQTRYGHKFELRDVGWAQPGPFDSKSRPEFSDEAYLSNEDKLDERWVKIRTKAGMLIQLSDIGADPSKDKQIKLTSLDEIKKYDRLGEPTGKTDDWKDKDARFIRFVSRHGYKFVIDDRGTDKEAAEEKESPRGNGVLIKGRRTAASKKRDATGKPVGFYWEFNENNDANHTTWGTPLGNAIEMNDRYQYLMLAANLPDWSSEYKGLSENEFIRKPTAKIAESQTHHLKIDGDNEYIRLKTRAGNGAGPDTPVVSVAPGEHQGFEARDGTEGDGAWVELVDAERRGIWMSSKYQISVWRAKNGSEMLQLMDDKTKNMVMLNLNPSGMIEIYSQGEVGVYSDSRIRLQSEGDIELYARNNIVMQAGGARAALMNDGLNVANKISTTLLNASTIVGKVVDGSATVISPPSLAAFPKPAKPAAIEPTDRAKTYNGPFEDCPLEEVEHGLLK